MKLSQNVPGQLSPLCLARYEEEPVSVRRAAERDVDRRWKKVTMVADRRRKQEATSTTICIIIDVDRVFRLKMSSNRPTDHPSMYFCYPLRKVGELSAAPW